MSSLVSLLIVALIFAIAVYLVNRFLAPPISTIINIIIGLVFVFKYLLPFLGIGAGF